MYQQQEINGRLWLNPGSCGYKRGTLPLSMAVMTIENGAAGNHMAGKGLRNARRCHRKTGKTEEKQV